MTISKNKNEALLGTIDLIYEASLEGRLWRDVLRAICDLTGSSVGVMALSDGAGYAFNLLYGIDPALQPRADRYFHDNPYMRYRHHLPSGRAVLGRQLASRDEIERSAFFQEVHRPCGAYHLCGIVLHNEADVFGEVSVYRGPDEEPHGREELELANAVAPHIRRAVKIGGLLEESRPWGPDFETLAESFGFGLILLARQSRDVLYANPRAEALLRGSAVDLAGRRAKLTRVRELDLSRLIEPACATRRPAAETVAWPDRRALQVVAVPLPARRRDFMSLARKADVALLLLEAVGERAPPLELVGSLYQLTPAELRLTEELLAGRGPAEIARASRLSRNTIKTQLRGLYAKLGVASRAELLRLLGPLTSTLRHHPPG